MPRRFHGQNLERGVRLGLRLPRHDRTRWSIDSRERATPGYDEAHKTVATVGSHRPQPLGQLGSSWEVEPEFGRTGLEPVEVGLEGEQPPVVGADDLEEPVAALQAMVEYGDDSAGFVNRLAVDENSHRFDISGCAPKVGPVRVLITGATGYLGTAMLEVVPDGVSVVPFGFSRGERSVDITDLAAVATALDAHSPDVVVHLAAVSEMAAAGANPGSAVAINATGARSVAAAAARSDIRLVALSSDVVFDGTDAPYAEDAIPNPINDYGKSKLAGENAIMAEHSDALIIRTSVLVGRDRAERYPFSAFVLDRAAAGLETVLYENERRSFYPVTNAAAAIWECAGSDATGFIHIGATASVSRLEFGRRLIEAAGLDPSLAVSATGPADRPSDLTLDVSRARAIVLTPMPAIRDVIVEVLRDVGAT